MRKTLPLLLLILGVYYFWERSDPGATFHEGTGLGDPVSIDSPQDPPSDLQVESPGDRILANAFQNHTSNLQVEGAGSVIKVLRDDNEGSRHQRFILQLRTGQTLLVAHNIDLAPRIPSLREGDVVGFYGEYEWNAEGGVIHWTHHDPGGRHADGWLRHNGRMYR